MEHFQCPICEKLLACPVTVSCGHTFCRECARKLIETHEVCPQCHSNLLAKALSPNFMVQSFLQKHFQHDYAKRLSEVRETDHFFDNSSTPVVFVKGIICFPGANLIVLLLSKSHQDMVSEVLMKDKKFVILSDLNKKWVGFLVEIVPDYVHEGTVKLNVVCKERLKIDFISKKNNPSETVAIENITEDLVSEELSWVTKPTVLRDSNPQNDVALESKLMEFTQKCLSNLGNMDLQIVYTSYTREISPSFFMLSVLKISNDLLYEAFHSECNLKRLEIINNYVQHKKPARAHLRIVKEHSILSKNGYLVLFLSMIFLYLAKILNNN